VFLLNIYRYNEKDELGRGSLGTAVYAGVYDEQEGRNTVVRRYAHLLITVNVPFYLIQPTLTHDSHHPRTGPRRLNEYRYPRANAKTRFERWSSARLACTGSLTRTANV
jgi:hypothetical protein